MTKRRRKKPAPSTERRRKQPVEAESLEMPTFGEELPAVKAETRAQTPDDPEVDFAVYRRGIEEVEAEKKRVAALLEKANERIAELEAAADFAAELDGNSSDMDAEEVLAAAKNLIRAQEKLLECYRLHRPRNRAIDQVAAAKAAWEEVNG